MVLGARVDQIPVEIVGNAVERLQLRESTKIKREITCAHFLVPGDQNIVFSVLREHSTLKCIKIRLLLLVFYNSYKISVH